MTALYNFPNEPQAGARVAIQAIEEAQRILAEYIEPGRRDAVATVKALLGVLDRREVVAALKRPLNAGKPRCRRAGMLADLFAPTGLKIAGLSGDLKWIDDVELLNLVADAYFNVDNVRNWEARFLDATFGTGLVMTVNVGGHQCQCEQILSATRTRQQPSRSRRRWQSYRRASVRYLAPAANAPDLPIEFDVVGIACDATRIGFSCRLMLRRHPLGMMLRGLACEG